MTAPEAACEIKLSDYTVPDFLIDTVDLTFHLEPHATRVRSQMKLRRQGGHDRDLVLDGEGLILQSVRLNGRMLSRDQYRVTAGALIISNVGDEAVLIIENQIDPAANSALEGLYLSSGNFCTQCEPEGFRRITYFLDRPDVLARYSVTLIADAEQYPVLLANGNPVSAERMNDGKHQARWVDPHPKPSYLFALVAGKLTLIKDQFITQSGKTIDLGIYVEAHNADRCDHAMASLKHSMRWDEQTYGREYDLDVFNIVAVDDFNMGAMENKGLNIFNSRYILAKPDTATDGDYAGIESVVAHEYFHNWSGNRVTCRDWFQLSLKEGFTVFRDQEFSADMSSRAVKRIQDVNTLRQVQFAEDAGPQAHPVQPKHYREINNFYTATVYNKGAEVVRMLRNLLGATAFRQATDLYFDRFDGQAVRIEDFIACMAEVSGLDLSQFRHWYDYAGTPKLVITDELQAGHYRLSIVQSLPGGTVDAPPFMLPFTVALFNSTGQPVLINGQAEQTLIVTQSQQTWDFAIDTPAHETVFPSLNRGFTAPVDVEFTYSDEALSVLGRCDTDAFNRWDAMQRLMQRTLLNRIRAAAQAAQSGQDALPENLSAAFGELLHSAQHDPLFVAECIALPSESYLADQFRENTPVEWIHHERNRLRLQLAAEWESTLILVYSNQAPQGGYRFEAQAVGQRQLRRQLLTYLCSLNNPAWVQLAVEQFERADNMTESFNALTALSVCNDGAFDRLMTAFEARWRGDGLVMDKWFSLQAQRTDDASLQRLEALMQHESFSLKTPNRVRALIGTFARLNAVRFHAIDGSGYDWVADKIIELDGFNPQIAARMASAFNLWRRFDLKRADLMQSALKKMRDRPQCSPDLAEITGKALASAV
jgi:aminopeptidase N